MGAVSLWEDAEELKGKLDTFFQFCKATDAFSRYIPQIAAEMQELQRALDRFQNAVVDKAEIRTSILRRLRELRHCRAKARKLEDDLSDLRKGELALLAKIKALQEKKQQ